MPVPVFIGVQPGTRIRGIHRLHDRWILWLETRDFKYGTFLECHDNGLVLNTTEREDDGIETFTVYDPNGET